MKYVLFEAALGSGLSQLIPVIFPQTLCHDEVAEAIGKLRPNMKVIGAGDCTLHRAAVGGSSSTLGIAAGPHDERIINNIDYFSIVEESNGQAR